jgi:hypothetical protein
MADTDEDVEGPDASDDEANKPDDVDFEYVEPTAAAPTDEAETDVRPAAATDEEESDLGRTDLKVLRARVTLEEQAEAARRRVLGANRGRLRPAAVQTDVAADDEAETRERLRELVRGVEEETERLQDDVSRLRSSAGRAGATLSEEIERAANELAEQSAGDLETTVGQTATESRSPRESTPSRRRPPASTRWPPAC